MPDRTDIDATTLQQLLGELAEARRQIGTLVAIVGQQTPILAGLAPAQKTTTIRQLFAAYEKVRCAEASWREVRNRLRRLVQHLGDLRVSELTPTVWAEHVAWLKTMRTSRDAPFADHTINLSLGRAKEMVDFGVRAGLADFNPLKPARPIKTISARETFLTEPQIQQLLGGVLVLPAMQAQLVLRAFILCALDGLMRFNEVRHLRRDRISKDGVIELQAKQTKSRKRRMVALTPRALEALHEIPPVLGTPHFFANPDTGKLYGISTLRNWFIAARSASGVDAFAADGERVVFHTLRHSGASAADARGASPMAIKEALGHSSLATTQRYLHRHRENSARELAKLMADGAEAERRAPQRSPLTHNVSASTPKATGK